MADLQSHEVEVLRRSVAMVTPGQPSGLSREQALDVLGQLEQVIRQRDHLVAERARRSEHPSSSLVEQP